MAAGVGNGMQGVRQRLGQSGDKGTNRRETLKRGEGGSQ